MRYRLTWVVGAVAVLAAALTPAIPATAAPVPIASIRGGATQDTYSYAKAIRQSVWVDTGLTAEARPGGHVRVAADIIRPRELDRVARIPVIMTASPYFRCCGRGNQFQRKAYDAAGNPVTFPLYYDNYFVPRGYAVVLVDLAGTNRSGGCTDLGGRSDVTSATAVIDWLNGRGTAYTSSAGTAVATAYWSDGSVGMIGKSWDGTIAEAVAATGVPGLKTIVPESAISAWYDYFRADGAPLARESPGALAAYVDTQAGACTSVNDALDAGSPDNGDVTATYQARNYVPDEHRITASVFATEGVNDYNVLGINFGPWWQALPATVPKMVWLAQTGHVDPFDFRRAAWVAELHRWLDHYLMGIDNDVQRDPPASVERAPGAWVNYPNWPIPGTRPITWQLKGAPESFTDDPTQNDTDWAANPDSTEPDRLIYRMGPPLTHTETLSGTTTVTLTVTPTTPIARISAALVDYGTTTMRNYAGAGVGIRTLATESCWGDSTIADSACYLDTTPDTITVSDDIFARGWADLGHFASKRTQQNLVPGRPVTITFPLNTTDHTIPAGHTLALLIGGTDAGYVNPPPGRPTITLNPATSRVVLPLAG